MDFEKQLRRITTLALLIAFTGVILSACSPTDSGSKTNTNATANANTNANANANSNTSPGAAPTGGTFVQVERLARPGINEVLVISNDFLNAFNSITPAMDLSEAAAAVRAEVIATLNAVDMADGVDNVDAGAVATAFLPDVMRIDTSIDVNVNEPCYDTRAAVVNDLGAPIAGRKIEDDVIDITLSALIGAAVGDNVPYDRPTTGDGSTNPGIGHQPLNGQTAPKGPATFPFLAPAN
jgi:3D (Asp-Asp-Asp) domain-containing protein